MSREHAIRRWINPHTGKPDFSRFSEGNLEARTVAAAHLYKVGFYRTITKAAQELRVPYKRLWSRLQGAHPRTENGGNRTLLSTSEENAILAWAHRRITQGHHIQLRAMRHQANVILKATGRSDETSSRYWAKRFMRRHRDIFKRTKSNTRDARRKSMQDRSHIVGFYEGWKDTIIDIGVKLENTWNFDETGFQIGYLKKGTFVWTFEVIEEAILTDSHDLVSITGVEAISAAGEVIAPFLILPGVNLPVRWFKNNLDEEATITTSPTGYITDVLAHEWVRHFERLTRPAVPGDVRLLLMDGCENHFTEEIFFFCHQHNIVLFPLPPHLTHFLQPLDVGVFGIYKYWHQHVLYREIADGAIDFGKVDFLFHFQEIRKRTFKKSTILSAWAKCGLFPHNPSIVLDRLKDPLSSLTEEVAAETLPGYISEGSSSSDDSLESPQSSRRRDNPQTPISRSQFRWDNVDTPPLRIRTIERYSEYIRMRLEVSITSNVAITPSVSHVYDKLQKAHVTLSLNGIAATRELQRFKDKALRRLTLSEGTSLVCKYGPIRVGDARLRVARDEYNRRAAQQEEQRRLLKKDALDEVKFVRRWIAEVRSRVRRSVTEVRINEIYGHKDRHWKPLLQWKKRCDWWSKADRRRHLDSAVFLSQRYALHRQLHLGEKLIPDWEPAVPWPCYYDNEVITEALKFIVLDEQERQAKKSLLSFEVDGVEIVHEIEGDSDIESFIVVKGEEDEEEV